MNDATVFVMLMWYESRTRFGINHPLTRAVSRRLWLMPDLRPEAKD